MQKISRAAALVVASILLLLTACYHHGHRSRSRTTVTVDTSFFALDTEVYTGYDEDYYDWNTVLGDTRVDFRVRHFHGCSRVRIYDEDGVEVFDEYYCDYDYDWDGDEFRHISFSAPATPGQWLIRIEYFDFSGHLYLTLD
ncbi:MAG: hypothetical protein ACKVX7_12080 [Planctomycetota bacterium]